jgi:hypothetical protein
LKCPFTGLTLAPYRVLGYASWLSRDPLPDAEVLEGLNLYTCVANNPVNLTDPLGLMCKEEWEALRNEYIRNALLSYLAGDLAMRAALMGGPMAPVNFSIAAAGLGGYIASSIRAGISTIGAVTSPSNTSSPNR